MFVLPTQPQSIGKTLDSGIKLYIKGLSKVIPLTLIAAIAGRVPDFITMSGSSLLNPTAAAGLMGFLLVYIIVLLIVSIAVYGAVIFQYGSIAAGQPVSIMDSFKRGLRCSPRIIAAAILFMIAFMLGSVLLIIPGIILSLSLSLFSTAIVLDDKKVVDSLKFSHSLVWGNWWRTATIYMVPVFIMTALYMILFMIFGFGIAAAGGPGAETALQGIFIMNILIALINAVIGPLFYSITVVVYHDLKLRKGGSDLGARLSGA